MQQDSQPSSTFLQTLKPPNFPEHEQLKCPRCDSTNTKFCYYNNYNLSQPRHFCKNCRRYWTKGGALRNIPVGGGTRRTTIKRSSKSKNRQILCQDHEPVHPNKKPVLSSSKPPLTGSSQTSVPLPEPDPTRICNYQHPSMDSTRIGGIAVGPDHEPGVSPVDSFSLPMTGSLQNSVPVPVSDSESTRIYRLVMNQNQLDGQEASPVKSSSKPLPTGIEKNPVGIHDPTRLYNVHDERTPGEFSSLLEPNGQFLKLLQGSSGPGLRLDSIGFSGVGMDGAAFGTHSGRVPSANVSEEGQNGDSGCWNGGNGWPDLAIFTPGSGFQ